MRIGNAFGASWNLLTAPVTARVGYIGTTTPDSVYRMNTGDLMRALVSHIMRNKLNIHMSTDGKTPARRIGLTNAQLNNLGLKNNHGICGTVTIIANGKSATVVADSHYDDSIQPDGDHWIISLFCWLFGRMDKIEVSHDLAEELGLKVGSRIQMVPVGKV